MVKKKTSKKSSIKIVPQVGGKKLSIVPSPINKEQILKIFSRTPKEHIFNRPAKGGGTWDYVTGVYVRKVLNYVFGFLWDFEVVEHGREGNLVWVLGKLIIKDKKFQPIITKMQFGRADIKFKKNTKEALDFGNDLKAATTDALKKCASELGIASDVYGKNEFRDIGVNVDNGNTLPPPKTPPENNYESKLFAQVYKMNKKQTMTKKEIFEFINKKTGLKVKSINSSNHAQLVLATLLRAVSIK